MRRYAHDPEAAAAVTRAPIYDGSPDVEERALLSVIVGLRGEAPEARGALLRDLAAQTSADFEVVVGGGDGAPLPAGELAGLDVPVSVVAAPAQGDWRDAAVAAASGRYVSFLDASARVAPDYVAAVGDAVASLPGRVVQHAAAAAPAATLAERRPSGFADVSAGCEPLAQEPLDLATTVPFGPLVLAAHAVPPRAVRHQRASLPSRRPRGGRVAVPDAGGGVVRHRPRRRLPHSGGRGRRAATWPRTSSSCPPTSTVRP